jgi:hypothetical protein
MSDTETALVDDAHKTAEAVSDFYDETQAFIEYVLTASSLYASALYGCVAVGENDSFNLNGYHVKIRRVKPSLRDDGLFIDSDGQKVKVYEYELYRSVKKPAIFGGVKDALDLLLRDHFYIRERLQLFHCNSLDNNYLDLQNLAYVQDFLDTLKGITEASKQYMTL